MNFGELTDQATSFVIMNEAIEAGINFVDTLGETPTDIVLAWLLHNPVVSAVIDAPRTVEQFRQNLKAPAVILSTETLARLDAIWPGPGGGLR